MGNNPSSSCRIRSICDRRATQEWQTSTFELIFDSKTSKPVLQELPSCQNNLQPQTKQKFNKIFSEEAFMDDTYENPRALFPSRISKADLLTTQATFTIEPTLVEFFPSLVELARETIQKERIVKGSASLYLASIFESAIEEASRLVLAARLVKINTSIYMNALIDEVLQEREARLRMETKICEEFYLNLTETQIQWLLNAPERMKNISLRLLSTEKPSISPYPKSQQDLEIEFEKQKVSNQTFIRAKGALSHLFHNVPSFAELHEETISRVVQWPNFPLGKTDFKVLFAESLYQFYEAVSLHESSKPGFPIYRFFTRDLLIKLRRLGFSCRSPICFSL